MINQFLKRFGLLLVTKKFIRSIYNPKIEELTHFDEKNINRFREYSSCSFMNLYSIISSLNFIKLNKIPGDLVECGVYRGGCSMILSEYNSYLNLNKKIYAYDTYAGMPKPNDYLDNRFDGTSAMAIWTKNNKKWLNCSLSDVKRNFMNVKVDMKKTIFVKGRIEKTLKNNIPKTVSLLRLDLDLYEPTIFALENFYPLMPKNSIIYIDDYNHWSGCRAAVDKFFKGKKVYSHFVDPSCKLYIKI